MTRPFSAIWVVYDHPSDWPDGFIARLWNGEEPTGSYVASADLHIVRGHMLEMGLAKIPRRPTDDPVILETWL